MATFSSHLLDATNGSHAANVDVIIYQVYESGEKKVFCETIVVDPEERAESVQ